VKITKGQSIVVVLELTQEEAEILRELAGSVSGTGRARQVVDEIYEGLEAFVPESETEYFKGDVRAQEDE
jgi:hypothetical protein